MRNVLSWTSFSGGPLTTMHRCPEHVARKTAAKPKPITTDTMMAPISESNILLKLMTADVRLFLREEGAALLCLLVHPTTHNSASCTKTGCRKCAKKGWNSYVNSQLVKDLLGHSTTHSIYYF